MEEIKIVRLKSSDGVIIEMDERAARCSETIKDVLNSCSTGEGDEKGIVIPTPNIGSTVLRKFVEWAEHHKDEVQPEDNDDHLYEKTCDWDVEFLKVEQGMLIQLILAANYLNTRGLLNISTKALASVIKGKNTVELRDNFHIIDDFPVSETDESTKEEGDEDEAKVLDMSKALDDTPELSENSST